MYAMHPTLHAQIDNTQQTYNQKYESGELIDQEYDMNQLLKYQLIAQTYDTPINDEGNESKSYHKLARPLHLREFGSRTTLAPYTPDICLQDREADMIRGSSDTPNMTLAKNMTYQKGTWIHNNLYNDGANLQTIAEQVPDTKMVQYRQKTDALKKDYLKVFSNEFLGNSNLKFSQHKKPGDLVRSVQLDQEPGTDLKGRVITDQMSKPRTVKNYNIVQSQDGMEIIPRTEPDHMQLVGEAKTVIYSNPVYDPAARALAQQEQFQDNKSSINEQLQNKDNKVFIQKYKQMQQSKRDPNAVQEDRDKSKQQFLDHLKVRVKQQNQQKQVDYREQASDRDTDQQDFLEQLMIAPKSFAFKIDKTNPLFTGVSESQMDHFKQSYDNLQDQDKQLVRNAIRKFAKKGTDSSIKLSIAEDLVELAIKGNTGRRQLQVLVDPTATEQDINMAIQDIQERLVIKYRNTLPLRQAENKIKLLQHELSDIKHQELFKRSQNGKLVGNASKQAQNQLHFSQPQDQLQTDQRQTVKLSNMNIPLDQLHNTAMHARMNGSEQQIYAAYESTNIKKNNTRFNQKQAYNLKYNGSNRQDQFGEKLLGK